MPSTTEPTTARATTAMPTSLLTGAPLRLAGPGSWSGRGGGRVAALHHARRGAVRRRLHGAARAALELPEFEAVEPVGPRRQRREPISAGDVAEAEAAEQRLDPREVPVGVVVRGAVAELVEPSGEVRGVLARVG